MDPPASFSSLPPELVTKICHDTVLEKGDLIALRLTSKSQGIHLSATREFAKRYFKEILLVYTRYSLQAFVEICRHHIFGSVVRKVGLSYTRFLPECFEDEGKKLLDRSWSGTRPLLRRKVLNDIRLLADRCDEEDDLNRSDDARDLLAAAFTALSRWDHPLKLGVTSLESGALGRHRIHVHRLGGYTHWECVLIDTVALLSHAATFSNRVLQTLRIQGDIWDIRDLETPYSWTPFRRLSSSNSLSALSVLPELELDLGAEQVDSSQIAELGRMLVGLLRNATSLKILHLKNLRHSHDYVFLHDVFSAISTMALEKLTLSAVDLDQYMFKGRNESLRHLELNGCDFVSGNSLLSVQKHFPRLDYFLLMDPGWLGGSVVLKGARVVKDGINNLIESALT
jgi:hypothetical protein